MEGLLLELAKIKKIWLVNGEVITTEISKRQRTILGRVAGPVGVREHASHVVEGPDGRFGEGAGPVAVHQFTFCCGR